MPDVSKNKIENENTEQETVKVEENNDNYREKYLRKLAEFDNYRKMLQKEMNMEIERCRAEVIREFIEPYENLQRAIKEIKEGRDGVELVLKQMDKILRDFGLNEIDAKGEKFDPMLHEAIGVVEGSEDNVVVEVYQKGYTLNGTVLRHPKVLVSKKTEVKKDE